MKILRSKDGNVGEIRDDCWEATLLLVWPVDPGQLERIVRRHLGVELKTEDTWRGRAIKYVRTAPPNQGSAIYIIALRHWNNTPQDIASLAHEALHITHFILDDAGMKLTDDTQEAYCYLHDSIIHRCLKLLAKARTVK